MKLIRALYRRFAHRIAEVAKFGFVGGAVAIVDIGGNSLLHIVLGVGPLTSTVIATFVATSLAFLGNRYWTWRHRDRTGLAREYFLFFVMNGIALLIRILCTGFTVYTLKLDSPLAYTISTNVVGVGLGTLFRFWAYRKWVFLPPTDPPIDPTTGLPEVIDEERTPAGLPRERINQHAGPEESGMSSRRKAIRRMVSSRR